MLSREQIEDEIRRLEAAAGFDRSCVTWKKVMAIRRILRWTLGVEPQSPLDRIKDPAPDRLPEFRPKGTDS